VSAWLISLYPWIKSAHIFSIVAWMAGLLYLPRLFVYHAPVPAQSECSALFKVMERRLQNAIMTPAMILSWMFGGLLAAIPGVVDWHMGWIWAKLALAVMLVVYHVLLWRWRRAFAAERNRHSSRFFRVINEFPTVVLLAIVVLVVVKPF
jgi:protoporphyrinogen IX oxidase